MTGCGLSPDEGCWEVGNFYFNRVTSIGESG